MLLIIMTLMGRSEPAGRCDLEKDGWCDFDDNICVFSDVNRKTVDTVTPIETLLNQNIRSSATNNKCKVPVPGDPPFNILVEPCYSNGTATPKDAIRCPDIPDGYYTDVLTPVKTDTGEITDVPGFVTGIPTEFNVLSIGKNLVLGNLDNTQKLKASTNVQGSLVSDFKWRTLPIGVDAYRNVMEETANSIKNISANFSKLVSGPSYQTPASETSTCDSGSELLQANCYGTVNGSLQGCTWTSQNQDDAEEKFLSNFSEPENIFKELQKYTYTEALHYPDGTTASCPSSTCTTMLDYFNFLLPSVDGGLSKLTVNQLLTDKKYQNLMLAGPQLAKLLTYGMPLAKSTSEYKCSDTGYTSESGRFEASEVSFWYWTAFIASQLLPTANPNSFFQTQDGSNLKKTMTRTMKFGQQNILGSPTFTFNGTTLELGRWVQDCFMDSSKQWNPFRCTCVPLTISGQQCINNMAEPKGPLNVIIGDDPPYTMDAVQLPPPEFLLVPYSELTCPLEVQFEDDRTVSMSATQQLENVYVESAEIFSDIPKQFTLSGRGCYMCFADAKENLTETLSSSGTWISQYHQYRCKGKRIVPSVQSLPPEDFKAETVQDATQLFDLASAFIINENIVTTDQPLGVYTLYPYVPIKPLHFSHYFPNQKDFDAGNNIDDEDKNSVFVKWQQDVANQIAYYMNPDWHITVEVVAMEKLKGSIIGRNFHGRIIEEGMAIFEADKFSYNNVETDPLQNKNAYGQAVDMTYWNAGYFYPNNCLFDKVDISKVNSFIEKINDGNCFPGEEKDANGNCIEIACETAYPGDKVVNVLEGNLTVHLNIDLNEILIEARTLESGSKIYENYATGEQYTMVSGGEALLNFLTSDGVSAGYILPAGYDGIFPSPMTNPTNGQKVETKFTPPNEFVEFIRNYPIARRKDGVCLDAPGAITIEMPFAVQCLMGLDSDIPIKTPKITISVCSPELAIKNYEAGNNNIDDYIQNIFNDGGASKDLLKVFDSWEWKVACGLLSYVYPRLAQLALDGDFSVCLSQFGTTSAGEVFGLLALSCSACDQNTDSKQISSGEPFACMEGPPCFGYMGPGDGDMRNQPGYSSVTVAKEPVYCWFEQVTKVLRDAKLPAKFLNAQVFNPTELKMTILYSMCDNVFLDKMMRVPLWTNFDSKSVNDDIMSGIALKNFEFTLPSVQAVVDEINILGITVTNSLFKRSTPQQFPNGVFVTSTHPLIHTKITRVLGSGTVQSRGCNVIQIGMPNVTFQQVEFDNAGCQEQALNQLTYLNSGDPDIPADNRTYARGLFELKAWNMAPIHVTNLVRDYSPTGLKFQNIKLTASISFRKMYPGRPLMSIDNDGSAAGAFVNIDGMYLDTINDTHKYRDDRDNIGNVVPLMPLHIIMWHVAGDVYFGTFDEELDVVVFSEKNSVNLFYTLDSDTTTTGPCDGLPLSAPASDNEQAYYSYASFTKKCLDKGCYVKGPDPRVAETGKWYGDINQRTYCFKNTTFPILNNLVLLDGNDFFDIAYDRYRCFDVPKLNCAGEPILPFIYVTIAFVGLYLVFFTFIRSAGLFQPDECLEILQSVDDALRDATKPGKDPLSEEDAMKEDVFEPKQFKLEELQEKKDVSDRGENILRFISKRKI